MIWLDYSKIYINESLDLVMTLLNRVLHRIAPLPRLVLKLAEPAVMLSVIVFDRYLSIHVNS